MSIFLSQNCNSGQRSQYHQVLPPRYNDSFDNSFINYCHHFETIVCTIVRFLMIKSCMNIVHAKANLIHKSSTIPYYFDLAPRR